MNPMQFDLSDTEDQLIGPDGGEEGRELAAHWLQQIDEVNEGKEHKRWLKRGDSIIKRYRDERTRAYEDNQRRYNALWSNIEILRPALYGKAPLPIAQRRFKDKDPVGRAASQILERALRTAVEDSELDDALQQAVMDYLLPGRGTVWVRYSPEFEEGPSIEPDTSIDFGDDDEDDDGELLPDGQGPDEDPVTEKLNTSDIRILKETVPVDYVYWQDFFTFPVNARVWKEVTAIGKRVYMSRNQMVRRFGKTIGNAIPLQKEDRGIKDSYDDARTAKSDKGEVFEIWDRDTTKVIWIARGYPFICDHREDPLRLTRFFPCPRPLYSNATTNTLVPVPDYIQYQDQAMQIDDLTQRIALLSKACKVAGVYNAAANDIKRIFDEGTENQLIPVDDWAAFAEKGGVAGNISFIPLQEIIGVINELTNVKNLQIEEMDRLTGINDIMRGTTDARETLGAVRLKSNTSGTRLTHRQAEVARFARDTVRLMAEIMANHFSPQTLVEMSGALFEEGLGPDDMPDLSTFQAPPAAPAQPQLPPPVPAGVPGGPGPMPPQAPPMPPQQPPMAAPGPNGPPMGQTPAFPPMPPQQMAQMQATQRIISAMQLLKNEKLRGFRVDIEVDSTIYGDAEQEKQDRTEFIAATTGYLQQAMAMSMQAPEMIPLLGKLLQFGVRGHRVGRDLELAIEDFIDETIKIAPQRIADAKNQPNPEQQKIQLEAMKAQSTIQANQARIDADKQKTQVQMQISTHQLAADAAKSQAEINRQHLENQGEQVNAELAVKKAQIEQEMQLLQLEMEKIKMQVELAKLEHARHEMQNDRQVSNLKVEKAAAQVAAPSGGVR